MHLTAPPGVAPPHHVRHPIPLHHRPLPRSHRHADAQAAGSRRAAPGPVRRRLALFKALALSSPQHGLGRKHHRRIALEPWQQTLVYEATEEFVLGLIHSDGCRVVANDRGVRSVRYHFSNRSEDIIGLFTAARDHLEIPWTRSTKYIVSIYRKAAIARMDEFIGPKTIAVPWTDVHYTA